MWWVIVYRQFHNYDGVIFLYCHVSDSNYRLSIDTEIFLFGFIHFRWTGFYWPYSISDFPVSITDRIKTYTSENGERFVPTVSDRFHPYQAGTSHALWAGVRQDQENTVARGPAPSVENIGHLQAGEPVMLGTPGKSIAGGRNHSARDFCHRGESRTSGWTEHLVLLERIAGTGTHWPGTRAGKGSRVGAKNLWAAATAKATPGRVAEKLE
jgi:hypothetical protein